MLRLAEKELDTEKSPDHTTGVRKTVNPPYEISHREDFVFGDDAVQNCTIRTTPNGV